MSRPPIPNIKVKLTPSLVAPVTAWAERFNRSELHVWGPVTVVKSVLSINPYEVCNFMRLGSVDESSDLDLHRLRSLILKESDAAIKRARSTSTKNALALNRDLLAKVKLGEWNGTVPVPELKPKVLLSRV